MINNLIVWQVALLALMILSGLAFRFELISFKGFAKGFGLGLLLSLILAVTAIVLTVMQFLNSESGGFSYRYIIALVLGFLVIDFVILVVVKAKQVPRIHDITTDLVRPPEFSVVREKRNSADNSLEIDSQVLDQQKQGYPNLQSLLLSASPEEVFNQALVIVKSMGWEVHYESASAGIIEASDKTAIFGFVDDVSIRIEQTDSGCRVDMRSASRVGKSDLGKNAQRIRSFLSELKAKF